MVNAYNPLLLIDFYKATHQAQYPQNLTQMVSYYTPRMSRLKDTDHVTMFGLQAFIKEYLIDGFNTYFFSRNEAEVVAEYEYVLTTTLGEGTYDPKRIRALHRLGYLPLFIRAVPEGTRTKIGVPQIEISNIHPNFVWLVNTIETMLSCTMWHTQIAAEVGYRYYQITKKYAAITGGDPRRMIGDFSMRGQHSVESALKASAAWLLSHRNTATVAAPMWINKYYGASLHDTGHGAISTEHSVMCSNYAVDGDEITHIKRLLTEIYPNNSFSMVSDSYDYWNLVDNILPQCKEEIMNHNGCLSIRGDSGDPVEVVTKTVFHLWDIFGGTVNEKGFKVLDPHIRAIYGDSITPQRAENIYEILIHNGFSVENVALGAGSFSFMCLETINSETGASYSPYTRDTFGVAVKATYAEDAEGNSIMIYKQPKALSWKKSQKGCCVVAPDGESYTDEWTFSESCVDDDNFLQPVFRNGYFCAYYTWDEVRKNMYPEDD